MTERNGERRDHPPHEPAPAVTSKARSDEWVYDVFAGGHAAGYTRPGGAPAPTLTAAGLSTGRDVMRPTHMAKKEDRPERVEQGAGNRPRSVETPAATLDTRTDLAQWVDERPATAVCADPRISPPGYRGRADDYDAEGNYTGERIMDKAVRVTEQEAAILQSFPPDYPFQGSRSKRFEQIGNAVPPVLAEAVLRALLGEEASR